jgi:PAS domain S-box-containing protein
MEQRAMVDRLRQSEQRLHQIVQNMPVLVMAHGEDDLVQFWNAECERVSGYAQNEIVGNPEAEKLLCLHGYLGGNAKGLDSYRNVECILTTKDGNTRTILWSDLSSGCPVPGWSRWAVGIDITEQRRHEDNFRHAQKMSAVGELAAGVAHDFNNLLHVILGSNDQVLEAPRLDEEARQAARNVRHAAKRGSDLVRQLMYFSRRESFHPEPQDLGLLVKHTLPVLRQGTGKGVRIRFVPAEGPCLAKVDAGQLGQALLNLCLNASDAMDCRTGHIEIGVQLRELSGEEAACRNLDSGDPGPGVRAVLHNQGEGTGLGHGLGLHLCHHGTPWRNGLF